MFIGRETELGFLEDRYNSDRGQLIVLYAKGSPTYFFHVRRLQIPCSLRNFLQGSSARSFPPDSI